MFFPLLTHPSLFIGRVRLLSRSAGPVGPVPDQLCAERQVSSRSDSSAKLQT